MVRLFLVHKLPIVNRDPDEIKALYIQWVRDISSPAIWATLWRRSYGDKSVDQMGWSNGSIYIYLKRLSYLLCGSVASLPSPSSNIEAWPYGTSLRFASLLHLGHWGCVNIFDGTFGRSVRLWSNCLGLMELDLTVRSNFLDLISSEILRSNPFMI